MRCFLGFHKWEIESPFVKWICKRCSISPPNQPDFNKVFRDLYDIIKNLEVPFYLNEWKAGFKSNKELHEFENSEFRKGYLLAYGLARTREAAVMNKMAEYFSDPFPKK